MARPLPPPPHSNLWLKLSFPEKANAGLSFCVSLAAINYHNKMPQTSKFWNWVYTSKKSKINHTYAGSKLHPKVRLYVSCMEPETEISSPEVKATSGRWVAWPDYKSFKSVKWLNCSTSWTSLSSGFWHASQSEEKTSLKTILK